MILIPHFSARIGDEARAAFDRGVELTIENASSVDLSLRARDGVLDALNLVNVSDARVTFREENSDGGEEDALFSPEEIYLYALIGVSALCLVTIVALIAVSVCLCLANSRYLKSSQLRWIQVH